MNNLKILIIFGLDFFKYQQFSLNIKMYVEIKKISLPLT